MSYEPLIAITRGDLDESMHFGAVVVADAEGKVLASAGSPRTTRLRSSPSSARWARSAMARAWA